MILQSNSDCKQPECSSQPGAHDPQHALQKTGGLADLWYTDDGDIMCHPTLVLSFLQDFEVANARVGAERNPLKTEVIYHVDDLDAAPLEWSIGDVQSMAKSFRNSGLQESTLRLGSGLLNGSSQVSPTQATLGAGQSGIGYKRARDVAAPAHLGALTAAKSRIHAMIRDAVWSKPSTKAPLGTRLAAVIETATSTYLSALSLAASIWRIAGAWRHKPDNVRPRTPQLRLRMKTVMIWTSQRPGRAGPVRFSSKRSFHG